MSAQVRRRASSLEHSSLPVFDHFEGPPSYRPRVHLVANREPAHRGPKAGQHDAGDQDRAHDSDDRCIGQRFSGDRRRNRTTAKTRSMNARRPRRRALSFEKVSPSRLVRLMKE